MVRIKTLLTKVVGVVLAVVGGLAVGKVRDSWAECFSVWIDREKVKYTAALSKKRTRRERERR